jgi:hypothetical protein
MDLTEMGIRDLTGSGSGLTVGSSEDSNKPSSMKSAKFLCQLTDHQLLKEYLAPWCSFIFS